MIRIVFKYPSTVLATLLGVHLAFSSLDAFLRSTGRFMPGLDRICLSSDPHSGSDLPSLDLFCACAPLAHGRACLGLG